MILVTGGTGLVGARLLFDLSINQKIRALKRENSSMKVVKRIFKDDPERINNVEWVVGDLNDIYSLEQAIENVDVIYHAAAFISFRPEDRKKMMKVNGEGTANLVNLCLDKKDLRFCYVSSVAALGRIAGIHTIDENVHWKTSSDNSNYAISKYSGEREVWRGIEEGLSAFIINPTIIIGPGDWNSGSAQMFTTVKKGLKFYTSGSTGFVDYRDVSRCAILLMNLGVKAERYIINAENVSYRHVFNSIADNLNMHKPTILVTPTLAEIGWRVEKIRSLIAREKSMITKETARNGNRSWFYSNEKIKKTVNINFIPIEESIAHTASLMEKN